MIQNSRWDAEREISADKSLLVKTISLVDEKKNLIDQLKAKIRTNALDQKTEAQEQKKLDQKKIQLNKVFKKDNLKLLTIQKLLNDSDQKLNKLSLGLHTNQGKLEFLQRQLSFYNLLVEKKEGYPEGVRNILNSPKDFPDVIGTVGELFQIDHKYKLP